MASSDVIESGDVQHDPYRSFIYGQGEKDTVWRTGGPPNYEVVNRLFEEGRTNVWAPGTREEKVQRLLKTWEMELVHKVRPQDYKVIDAEAFTHSVNGTPGKTMAEVGLIGSYNQFLQTSLPEELRAYDPSKYTMEEAQTTFLNAFPRGFAVEILEVYSGPPKVAYKFRHFSTFDGPFQGHAPTGELVQLIGIGIFTVDESTDKVGQVEFFYDPDVSESGAVQSDPYRSFIYGEEEKDTVWRTGAPPNYEVVNRLFEEGRTNVWAKGTLEEHGKRNASTKYVPKTTNQSILKHLVTASMGRQVKA